VVKAKLTLWYENEEGERTTLGEWWKRRLANKRSKWFVRRARLDNCWQDLRAVLAGACNASTWDPTIPGYHGYSHWRCAKKRGHDQEVKVYRDGDYVDGATYGPHRFNNYTWVGPGHKTQFAPLEPRPVNDDDPFFKRVVPFQKLAGGRRAVSTRRHSRLMYEANQRMMELQRAQRRPEDRASRAARLSGALEAAFRRAHLAEEPLPYPNEQPLKVPEHPQLLRPVEDVQPPEEIL
jgi:hypothetical protein